MDTRIVGIVEEIHKSSYIDLRNENNEVINCYIVKSVACKQQIKEVGQKIEIEGHNKEFKGGKNYFVIHRIKRLENEKIDYSKNIELANNNSSKGGAEIYFQDVLKHVFKVQFLEGSSENQNKLEIEMRDTAIQNGDYKMTFSKHVDISDRSSFKFSTDIDFIDQSKKHRTIKKSVFHTSKVVEALQGMNLGLKKWGAKFEGKLKVEVLAVRFQGNQFCDGSLYRDIAIDEEEHKKEGGFYKFASSIGKIQGNELTGWFKDLMEGKNKSKDGKKAFFKNNCNINCADAIDYLSHIKNDETKQIMLNMTELEGHKHKVIIQKIRITIVR